MLRNVAYVRMYGWVGRLVGMYVFLSFWKGFSCFIPSSSSSSFFLFPSCTDLQVGNFIMTTSRTSGPMGVALLLDVSFDISSRIWRFDFSLVRLWFLPLFIIVMVIHLFLWPRLRCSSLGSLSAAETCCEVLSKRHKAFLMQLFRSGWSGCPYCWVRWCFFVH